MQISKRERGHLQRFLTLSRVLFGFVDVKLKVDLTIYFFICSLPPKLIVFKIYTELNTFCSLFRSLKLLSLVSFRARKFLVSVALLRLLIHRSFPLSNFTTFPTPLLKLINISNKSSCLSAICLCCSNFHSHWCLVYKHRKLHSSIILDCTAFIPTLTPPSIGYLKCPIARGSE